MKKITVKVTKLENKNERYFPYEYAFQKWFKSATHRVMKLYGCSRLSAEAYIVGAIDVEELNDSETEILNTVNNQ